MRLSASRMTKYRQRLSEFLPIFFIIISVGIFFGRVIYSGKPLSGSDFVLYFHPLKKFIRDYVLSQGTIPFWNPYLFSGTPFIANVQASMFYPLGFIYYLVAPEYAYGYATILHCFLGAVFMFVLMRTLSVAYWGAFLSAFVFIFNGYFMAHLYAGHLTFVQNYIWIPLVFFFVYRFVTTICFRWALGAGLSLGTQILGGFPQIAFYTILAILALGAFYIGISLKARHARNAIMISLGLVVIVVTGFALAAIQLLPTLEFMQLSGRAGGVSYWFATLDSFHPKMFLSFLIPDIFGNAVNGTYWLNPKDWTFWETCGYVGILPLCLIFVSCLNSQELRRIRSFFIGLAILALFLALGKYNPLYPLFYNLPGFHNFRIPAQILFLYVFAIAVLSGIGLNHLQQGSLRFTKSFTLFLAVGSLGFLFLIGVIHLFPYDFFSHLFKTFAEQPIAPASAAMVPREIVFSVSRSALLFFSAVLLLALCYKKRIGRTLFNGLVITVVVFDLGLYSVKFVKSHEFITSKKKQDLVNQSQDEPGRGRTLTLSSRFLLNDGLVFRFASIGGYDPLVLKRYILYLQASQQLPQQRHALTTSFVKDYNHKFLRMLNLKHAVQDERVVALHDFVPRAIIVDRAVVKQADEVLDFMKTDTFNPLKMVVLEPESQKIMLPHTEGDNFASSCSIRYYDNENIQIKTSANRACYLVLSEIFYPGWEAKVDAKEVPIVRGNYIFRVIPLKPGEHQVELRFISWPFRIGATISLLTLICSGIVIASSRRRHNRSPG